MALDAKNFLNKKRVSSQNLVGKTIKNNLPKNKKSLFRGDIEEDNNKIDTSLTDNFIQSGSKVGQKQIKSRLKVDQNLNTKQIKSRLKVDQEKGSKTESRSKVGLEVDQNLNTKRVKSRSKVDQNISVFEVVGLQKKLLIMMFNDCLERGTRHTETYNLAEISERAKCSKASAKSALRQLIIKNLIKKVDFKDGRGGGTSYEIFETTYRDCITRYNSKVDQKWFKSSSKVGSKVGLEVDQNASSSSSSNILNTITTDKILEQIQTPQNLKSLGFGIGHIKQLKEKFNLSVDEIQKNLESFAYDLDNGELERLKGRGIQNIIGYFFGAIKSGGYNSVIKGFVSAEDLAEQEMLERLEKNKTEKEERKKKLEELLFEEWLETKTKDDLVKIEAPMINYMDSFHKAALKGYFLDNEMFQFQKEYQ